MDNIENVHLDISELEESVENEYEGFASPFSPLHFDYRFTFSDQDKELKCLDNKQFIGRCKSIHRVLINKMSDNGYFYLDKFTSGFETMNKLGESCKAHIHIRFQSTKVKESMNKTIKSLLKDDYSQDYLGNKCYSFKPTHVRDEEEFWRYPLKQSLDTNVCRGFSTAKLTHMHEVAKDSWFKTCQVNLAKRDKRDKDDTLFLRCLADCKKNNDNTERAITKTMLRRYREEMRPINRQVIQGYAKNAMLDLNVISEDELLDTWGL